MNETKNTEHVLGFVEDHVGVMNALIEEVSLTQETILMFGKTIPTPRLTSWHGDAGREYTFSGRNFTPNEWTPTLTAIRDALEVREGIRFNSVLINYYRDGSDSVAFHADDEPELGPTQDDVRIASVSLGDERRFILKSNDDGTRREYNLGAGSLLIMRGDLQRTHKHAIPKTRRPVGPRLNLTFRVIR